MHASLVKPFALVSLDFQRILKVVGKKAVLSALRLPVDCEEGWELDALLNLDELGT